MNQTNRSRQSGFALLLVLMMASIIALMLYEALPRAVFEGERFKEDLLIQRGEEYKRAIQLYLRKLGRYPTTIDQLEETNNMRFLRHRYADPMTGKDDWRLIHAGPGGMLLDSLVQRIPQVQGISTSGIGSGQSGSAFGQSSSGFGQSGSAFGQSGSGFGQSGSGFGQSGSGSGQSGSGSAAADSANDPDAGQPVPLRLDQRRRQSDGPGGSPMPGGDAQDNNLLAGGVQPPPGQSPSPQTEMPGAAQASQTGLPSAQTGQLTSGDSGQAQTPGTASGVVQGIMNGLMSGSPQLGAAGQSGIGGSGPMGGGIAGVASKSLFASIKVYNDQKRYKKWEFVYDPTKDLSKVRAMAAAGLSTGPGMGGGVPGMNTQQMGANPFNSGMQPGGNSPSPQSAPQPAPQQQ